ncbi:MAG: cytochrome o ubiquinol oxidase subunit III [Rhabdochlamydiaceae bacterium]|jgi:cytochrome o ubiquinol oxidase subunit 3
MIEENDTKIFGFWVYLMTDLVIFAVLFATFIVLRDNTFGGPSGRELFDLPSALAETLLLLTSSFTCSLATLAVHRKQKNLAVFWFIVTFALGVSFLSIEISEFSKFIHEGADWRRSGFLSSFFTLVGTHGLHISVGLLWMIVAMSRLCFRELSPPDTSRIFRLAFFWHFLDVVWVFIFTVVYGLAKL